MKIIDKIRKWWDRYWTRRAVEQHLISNMMCMEDEKR